MLLDFLSPIPVEELWRFVRQLVKDDEVRFGIWSTREQVHNILFSLYSFSILSEARVRRLVVIYAPNERVEELAEYLGCANDGSRYDLAVEVSLLPWKRGSMASNAFHRVLRVPKRYLPRSAQGQPAIEDVDARRSLPPLYDYQEEVKNKIKDFLEEGNVCSTLVQLPTGSGKTRTALEGIIEYVVECGSRDEERLILWLAHTEELCEQGVESFKRVWNELGDVDVRVGRYWGSYNALKELDELDVLFCGYQKVVRVDDQLLEKSFGERQLVVVIDEAHKALAPTIRAFLERLEKVSGFLKIIGLTATPGRSFNNDGENIGLRKLFGNALITSDRLGDRPIEYLQSRGILATNVNFQRRHYASASSFEENEEGDYSRATLKKIGKDKKRNRFIVDIATEEVEDGRRVLLFACNVEHSKLLALMLAAKECVAVSVDCKMRSSDRRKAIEEFKQGNIDVLVNYGILTTGYDDPTLETIVIARPTTSIVLYSQMVGRALRGERLGGSAGCRIIDIHDQKREFGNLDDVYSYFDSYWQK